MYKNRTNNDLRAYPLAAQLQACEDPSAVHAVLQEQVQGLDQSWSTDERWTKWLIPTVNVLYAFSAILGAGVGLVCLTACACMGSYIMSQLFSPASMIFAGVGVLLSVRILDDFVWAIVTYTFPRLLKMFEEARTLFSASLSALKCFLDVSTSIQKCGRPRK